MEGVCVGGVAHFLRCFLSISLTGFYLSVMTRTPVLRGGLGLSLWCHTACWGLLIFFATGPAFTVPTQSDIEESPPKKTAVTQGFV